MKNFRDKKAISPQNLVRKKTSFSFRWSFLKQEKALIIVSILIFFLTFLVVLEMRDPKIVISLIKSEEVSEDKREWHAIETAKGVVLVENPDYEPAVYKGPVNWQSFGDSFSSDIHLDMSNTSLYVDKKITSVSFPPLYNLELSNNCADVGCGYFGRNDVFYLYDRNVNIIDDLQYMPNPLPVELRDKTIMAAKISKLERREVALFVVKRGAEEQVYAYFLNGDNYEPLITDSTENKMITKYGKGGGIAVASGDDNNFLITYGGYQLLAAHYLDGQITDISKFFSLRVADEGFYPYVIKQGEGVESTWYIVSASQEDVRLIKLWQNSTSKIQGAYDISENLFEKLSEDSALFALKENSEKGRIEFLLAKGLSSPDSMTYQELTFKDYGFDNKENKQLLTKNINDKNYLVYSATINDIGVTWQEKGDDKYIKKYPVEHIEMYLGDSLDNLELVVPKQEISFSGDKKEVYLQIKFYPIQNSEHSPWLDHVNDLRYLVSFD